MRVRIVSNWDRSTLRRQTPGMSAVWDDIEFVFDDAAACDYLVICNRVEAPFQVRCPADNVWLIVQEPPDELHRPLHRGIACAHRVYTQDASLIGQRYVHSQPALPWHVKKSFDELISGPVPEKTRRLSWITSDKAITQGHRARLRFLNRIRDQVDFDLWGRGFRCLDDKWDALAPYRYSLAVENYGGPYYWSEKLTDCFLAWTMPIYYGCTRIADYFPPESMVRIDIDDPLTPERIREVIASDKWRRSLDAIAEARELALRRYQMFPFLAREVRAVERSRARDAEPRTLLISNKRRPGDIVRALHNRFWRVHLPRLVSRIIASATRAGRKR